MKHLLMDPAFPDIVGEYAYAEIRESRTSLTFCATPSSVRTKSFADNVYTSAPDFSSLSIHASSAEKNRSAGAPLWTCRASAEEAANDTIGCG